MVQMKDRLGSVDEASTRYFISHMVQMKALGESQESSRLFVLYIPHGSDES